jgi:hypothetical protein
VLLARSLRIGCIAESILFRAEDIPLVFTYLLSHGMGVSLMNACPRI